MKLKLAKLLLRWAFGLLPDSRNKTEIYETLIKYFEKILKKIK